MRVSRGTRPEQILFKAFGRAVRAWLSAQWRMTRARCVPHFPCYCIPIVGEQWKESVATCPSVGEIHFDAKSLGLQARGRELGEGGQAQVTW